MGDVELRPILEDREYVLSNLTLTIVTGLTLEHSRVLLGYCLSYGENHDDTKFFLEYLLANGGEAINSAENIVMSDRGAGAPAVDEVLTKAIHHYCPKHLERNLKGRGCGDAIVKKFWQARNAPTNIEFESAMKQMEKISKTGRETAAYLRSIPNWQVYLVEAKKALLHQVKSDNMVEGMFASLKDARCQASPIFTSAEIIARALKLLSAAEMSVPKAGFLTNRALRLSGKRWIEARSYIATQTSAASGQWRVVPSTKGKVKVCNVNLSEKTCSCRLWQQEGGPCAHAWRAIAPQHIDMIIDTKYFYEFSLVTRLQAMFVGYKAMEEIDLDDVRHLKNAMDFHSIKPRTELIPIVGKSNKRARSKGDGKGGLTQGDIAKRARNRCEYCTKTIAKSNKTHALTPVCFRYAEMHERGLIYTENIIAPVKQARAAPFVPVIDPNMFSNDSSDCSSDDNNA